MVLLPTPIEDLKSEISEKHQVKLMIKRDDLIHPEIMGNKWRKLKYNLLEAEKLGFKTLLTFGGAYSNHIAATAAAAKEFGFKSIGVIRGDELTKDSNPTLTKAYHDGMELHFMDRDKFRILKNDHAGIHLQFPQTYILPEGGTNGLAIKGASEIIEEIDQPFDFMICPVGTGGTMAGLLSKMKPSQKLIGISSLKGAFVQQDFQTLLDKFSIEGANWQIMDQYHFGGYGKTKNNLIEFINTFKNEFKISLDPIYTGKMMFAVYALLEKGFFPINSKIMILHTGGLQGIAGFNIKNAIKIL